MHPVTGWLTLILALVITVARADGEPAADDAVDRFRTLMTGARLVGTFTTDGDETTRRQERYEISSAVKLSGDLWLLTARITYGEVDLTVPVPVAVKWAGETPVITLDGVAIPGLGTFSSRVVLDRDRYAGTWQHDAVGGHLFGRIERADAAGQSRSPSKAEPTRSTERDDAP